MSNLCRSHVNNVQHVEYKSVPPAWREEAELVMPLQCVLAPQEFVFCLNKTKQQKIINMHVSMRAPRNEQNSEVWGRGTLGVDERAQPRRAMPAVPMFTRKRRMRPYPAQFVDVARIAGKNRYRRHGAFRRSSLVYSQGSSAPTVRVFCC